MSTLQIVRTRPDPALMGSTVVSKPSGGTGPTSKDIEERLNELTKPSPTFSGQPLKAKKGLPEQLYDSLASFKVRTALVAMHLDRDWRARLFRQFDNLLSIDDWEIDDLPPTLGSYSTFLRMLLLLRPARRPGLGATAEGNLIATWTRENDRLTIECLPADIVRWHLSVTIEDECERAAAITPLPRLGEVLVPYDPKRWFEHADNIPPR